MPVFIFIGCMALISALLMLMVGRENMCRRRRILETPTSRTIEAAATGTVEIQGRIVPGEEGTVKSAFGEASVWFRTTIEERGGRGHWYGVFSESEGRPFYVDDGSAETPKIIPGGATIMLDEYIVASFGTWSAATPEIESFLASRGVKSTRWPGVTRPLRIVEQTLTPGKNLYALGPARREPIAPLPEGESARQATRLVLSQGDGEKGELILTYMTKQQLAKRLRSDFTWAVFFGALGATLVVLHFVIG